jgi:acyl CoA:acetate/3-ketoacid CoA transferase beta subunit
VREKIAKRAVMEVKNGMYINLGIGIPTLIPNYVPKGVDI